MVHHIHFVRAGLSMKQNDEYMGQDGVSGMWVCVATCMDWGEWEDDGVCMCACGLQWSAQMDWTAVGVLTSQEALRFQILTLWA